MIDFSIGATFFGVSNGVEMLRMRAWKFIRKKEMATWRLWLSLVSSKGLEAVK